MIARLGTNDLGRGIGFYDQIFAITGLTQVIANENVTAWGADGKLQFMIGKPFNGEPASVGNGVMIALPVADRAMVDAVHAKALSLGGKCEGPPGIRGDDPDGFYATYLRDLDGNKLCFFRMGAA